GATHQAVMEFQVVRDKRLPKIRAGRSIISFFYRKNMARVADAVADHKTDTGRMRGSSPELTAFDLLRYARAIGIIDSIATVLAHLADKIDTARLVQIAPAFDRTVIQRLGYLLDRLRHHQRQPLSTTIFPEPTRSHGSSLSPCIPPTPNFLP